MARFLFFIAALGPLSVGVWAQGRPVIVVNAFTTAEGVELPYDMGMLKSQLAAEFRVMLGKQFDIVTERPQTGQTGVYTLDAEFTGWRAGNAAKRLFVGLGSGREASDIHYRVTDSSGGSVLQRSDTVRTNFYTQASGSTGTLAHPIAQKIAERIKNAQLK